MREEGGGGGTGQWAYLPQQGRLQELEGMEGLTTVPTLAVLAAAQAAASLLRRPRTTAGVAETPRCEHPLMAVPAEPQEVAEAPGRHTSTEVIPEVQVAAVARPSHHRLVPVARVGSTARVVAAVALPSTGTLQALVGPVDLASS